MIVDRSTGCLSQLPQRFQIGEPHAASGFIPHRDHIDANAIGRGQVNELGDLIPVIIHHRAAVGNEDFNGIAPLCVLDCDVQSLGERVSELIPASRAMLHQSSYGWTGSETGVVQHHAAPVRSTDQPDHAIAEAAFGPEAVQHVQGTSPRFVPEAQRLQVVEQLRSVGFADPTPYCAQRFRGV